MSKGIQFRNKKGEKIYPCPYYPIGSIYLSVNNTNPETIFGGKWEQIKDKFLLACGSTYSNGSTGGEATHKLTTNEIPAHSHRVRREYGTSYNLSDGPPDGNYTQWAGPSAGTQNWSSNGVENTGGNAAHNNMPPYLVVYMWKRVS
ncbi:MAG: hypothetical protein PHV65_05480 [Bacteroidales bacterium]|nr:hypothetical protein [Bacteroidales bacterium]